MWSTLNHENIVRFVGVSISPYGPLSICEYFPEGSLFASNEKLLAQARARGSNVAFGMRSGWTIVSWIRQLCRAMSYLHTLTPAPVIFRNLKSPNVMLANNHTHLALTDFAICRPIEMHDNLTPAQGSDRWLAPEVQIGSEYDLRSDVFSCTQPAHRLPTRCPAPLFARGSCFLPAHSLPILGTAVLTRRALPLPRQSRSRAGRSSRARCHSRRTRRASQRYSSREAVSAEHAARRESPHTAPRLRTRSTSFPASHAL